MDYSDSEFECLYDINEFYILMRLIIECLRYSVKRQFEHFEKNMSELKLIIGHYACIPGKIIQEFVSLPRIYSFERIAIYSY